MALHNLKDNPVFISYSHDDEDWLEKLKMALQPIVRQGLDLWDDQRIGVGQERQKELSAAIERTRVAVLLVSHDYLGSDTTFEDQLLPLLKRTESTGLTILWIPVGPSSFHETPIKNCQAAWNPKKPLKSLSPSELDEALVKISTHIKNAVERQGGQRQYRNTKAGYPTPGSGGKLKRGSKLYKLCDRRRHESSFKKHFNQAVSDDTPPFQPLFYMVHGDSGQCHHSFVDRMIDIHVKQHVTRTWGAEDGSILVRKPSWPHKGSLAVRKEDLSVHLLDKHATGYAGTTYQASDLDRLELLQSYHVAVVQHTIRHWDKHTADLLTWYMKDYWTRASGGFSTRFIVFFNLIYPEEKAWYHLGHTSKKAIQARLDQLSLTPEVSFCKIQEIDSIDIGRVKDWLDDHQIFDLEYEREQRATQIFTKTEMRPMSEVEVELKKLYEEYQQGELFQ